MSEYFRSSKKLKAISWLMVASGVMLALFIGEWLRSQYADQKQRLHQDLEIVFSGTEQRMTDSLLDRFINIALSPASKGRGQVVTPRADTLFDDFALPQMGQGQQVRFIQIQRSVSSDSPSKKLKSVKEISIARPQDSILLHSEIERAMRMAMAQTINGFQSKGISYTVDSSSLKKQFEQELGKRGFHFMVYWDTTAHNVTAPFHYKLDDPFAHPLAVNGYRFYLFRSLLPQIGFSALLLLLTGLAFGLAYRNMKRQALFNHQKDSFISNISHELKTPIATTMVALEALGKYNALEDPARASKYLQVATWEMQRLQNMIDRIMDIILSENGKVKLTKETFALARLLQEITASLQPMMAAKPASLSWGQIDETLTVTADKTHIQGVLYNLLDNAIKYGGPEIGLHLEARESTIVLKVSDNGRGIAPQYREKIFEHFFRIPSGDVHTVKGHGLGLSYSRFIVQEHGGTLILESKPGAGNTFIVTLPKN